ncbi:MAG: TonB-dependent siderophore receptor [Panacagrimonas sp.]
MKNSPPLIAALGFALLFHSPLNAADEAEKPESAAVLDTIVVEGQRPDRGVTAKDATVGVLGDLPLIEAPYSVNVVNQHLIEIQQSTTYTDYLKNVPGVSAGNVAIGFFSLRGFAVSASDGGSGGYLYDGLPGHTALSEAYQLDGFDRIEVFKGPSAFLSGVGGASSLGGTLNYVPKRSTAEPVRSVEFEAANRGLYGVGLDVGERFGSDKQFGYRINARFREGEQAAERYNWRQQAGTLALDWRPTQTLSFALHLEHADNHFPEIPPFFALAPGVRVPKAPDASDNIALSWDDVRFEGKSVYGRADWTFAPDWTVTAQAISSQTRRPNVKSARFGFINDNDGNATLFGFEDGFENDSDNGQVLLRGRLATGPLAHRLTAGMSSFSGESLSAFAGGTGAFNTNIFNPVDSPEPPAIDPQPALLPQNKFHGSSLLLSDIVDFGEHWSLLLAGRHAKYAQDNFFDPDPMDADTTLARDEAASVSETSPTVALMFKPVTGGLLYVNYAEGLEPGGTAPIGTLNSGRRLDPLITEQVEIGAKLERANVTYTLALFDLKRPSEFVNSAGRFVQDGEQRHKGVELTVTGRLLPNLDVVAGTAFIDPKIEKSGDADGDGNEGDFDGKRPVSVPRVTANLFADYGLTAVPGLFLNAGVYHNAKQFLDSGNTQELESWTRFDLGTRYETLLGKTAARFSLGLENLADEDYWIGQGGVLTIANPLTVKLSARFDL